MAYNKNYKKYYEEDEVIEEKEEQPKKPYSGYKNLIPINTRPKEEQEAIRKKAQEARKANTPERRKFKSILEERLEKRAYIRKDENGEFEVLYGMEAIAERQIDIAIDSFDDGKSTKAFETIRDTLGQKPKEEVDMKVSNYEDYLKKVVDEDED